jgi:branched-chain amino acid transport system ATP-binding protein
MTAPILELKNVETGYGRLRVVSDVTLQVSLGQALAIIGPNGAGKTTLLRAMSAFLPIWSGSALVNGQEIRGRRADQVVGLGIAHVLQGRHIVGDMSVLDNLLLGAHLRMTRARRGEVTSTLDTVFDLFPILRQRKDLSAGGLSGGEQQMLAIGRALMARPRVLLLDEPSMGLAPQIIEQIGVILRTLKRDGMTIVLVEQNPELAIALADTVSVMESGRIAETGEISLLEDRERVALTYLGEED